MSSTGPMSDVELNYLQSHRRNDCRVDLLGLESLGSFGLGWGAVVSGVGTDVGGLVEVVLLVGQLVLVVVGFLEVEVVLPRGGGGFAVVRIRDFLSSGVIIQSEVLVLGVGGRWFCRRWSNDVYETRFVTNITYAHFHFTHLIIPDPPEVWRLIPGFLQICSHHWRK